MLQLDKEDARFVSTDSPHVYVYGIIRAEDHRKGLNLKVFKGLGGGFVRSINGDGLAALVSAVGPTFEDDLKDSEQTKSLILDHHRVLQRLLGQRTVLPMRFGALFANDEKVRNALRKNRENLLEALARVEGACEWGVKIFCDRSVLRRHLGEKSPAMLAAQGELAAATQGRAFFLQRRVARLGEEEVERVIQRDAEEGRRCLSDVARADAAMKLQPAAVHMRSDDMVANDAYLVATHDKERFFALIGELRQTLGPRGFDIETNGPWPPFSFADCRLGE